MSKLYDDIFWGLMKDYDVRTDYRFPERLNGRPMEEIRDFATNYIDSMHKAVVFFVDQPYGKGYAYFYNIEDPASTNEVVYAASGELRLNAIEIAKYLAGGKIRGLRPYIYVGENGAYTQVPARRLRRLSKDGLSDDVYADGKSEKDLRTEGYFDAPADPSAAVPADAATAEGPAAEEPAPAKE